MARFLCTRAANAMVLLLVAATATARPQVDVQFPGGSVNVAKGVGGGATVDVQHPAGSVNVGGGTGTGRSLSAPPSPSQAQADLFALIRTILGGGAAAASARATASASPDAKGVDVNYPGGSVNVRKESPGGPKLVDVAFPGGSVNVGRQAYPNGPKKVDVAFPGGSVNVGNNGNNVDVAFPGGFVKLDPKEPGKRRTGVVVFPFGSVRFG